MFHFLSTVSTDIRGIFFLLGTGACAVFYLLIRECRLVWDAKDAPAMLRHAQVGASPAT